MSTLSLPPEVLAPIRAVFFQECEELLAALDQGLNGLKRGDDDPETINTVFRVVHSIKGGAANFDLSRLAQFAHQIEMTLSDLRGGSVAADRRFWDNLLLASDCLVEIVEEAKGGAIADARRGENILRALAEYGASFDGPVAGALIPTPGGDPAADTLRTWQFLFRPHATLYYNANDPIPILRELRRLGDVAIFLDMQDLPALPGLEPEASYLSWSGTIITRKSEDQLRNVFEFVNGDCELEIFPAPDEHAAKSGNIVHAPEEVTLSERQKSRQAIRVDLDRVDKLFNLVGELLVQQTLYSQFAASHPDPQALPVYLEFGRLSLEIQEGLLAIRSQPIKPIFQRMSRLVRQLESATGKAVNFITEGESAEVDRSVLEHLSEPLTHMIRNAVDHGLETPEERRLRGKDPTGTIRAAAYHRFGRIVVEVSDDGKGIDREKVLSIAVSRGILPPNANLSEQEIDSLILGPGFSTAEMVSDISGRGVGMDVVNKSVRALGGRISISSQKGIGTTFTMSLPLTLALMDGMVVRVGEGLFVVPVVAILQSLQIQSAHVKPLGDARVLQYREQYIPLADLGDVLKYPVSSVSTEPVCLVVEDDLSERAALVVDEIVGRQQIVVKEIQGAYRPTDGISAATILGDGHIALIVDINDILERLKQKSASSRQLVA